MQSPLMRWSAVLMMLGSLLAGGSNLAQAQVANGGDSLYCRYPSLQPGMRIRVTCRTFGEYRPVGEFVSIHGDTLTLISASYGRRIKALLDDFSLVEVSSSRVTGDAKGALAGGFVGGSLGVGLMAILALGALASGDSKSDDELLLPVLVLGGLGAVIGSNMGRNGRTDEWDPLPQAERSMSDAGLERPPGMRLRIGLRF